MNRNVMYEYLKSIGLFPVRHKRSNGYHIEFRDNDESDMVMDTIITDWGYITGIASIYLCANEVVLKDKYGFTQINMKYLKINEFEIRMIEKE